MSRYKIVFTLKQHTPIIHFQSEQSGATLRATELKPKLDRFLLSKVSDIPKVKNANKHVSLDYKVKIESNGKTLSDPNEALFFANTLLDKKFQAVMANSVTITFFSFHPKILESIEYWFGIFLLTTNFGMRSSKGFGCFTQIDFSEDVESVLKRQFESVFKVDIRPNNWASDVDRIHKRLKSGTNYGGYHKSLLFRYMCDTHQIRWEKRKIKQAFPRVIRPSHRHPVDCTPIADDKFRFVRAMLGLAGNYEYNGGPKRGGELIEIKSNTVERFQSPITYKPIGNTLYLLGDTSYEKLFDTDFRFALGKEHFDLKTPTKNEFSLLEFLRYVERHENLIREVS